MKSMNVEKEKSENNYLSIDNYKIGTQLLDEDNLITAEKHFNQAIELNPQFVEAIDHLGLVYRRQNRLKEAEELYIKSINIAPRNSISYQNLAVVYELQDKLNSAFHTYMTMLDITSENPEPFYGIGKLFFTIGRYKESITFLDNAIELYINNKSTYVFDAIYFKGMVYYKLNEFEAALKYLEESLKGSRNIEIIKEAIDEIKNKL